MRFSQEKILRKDGLVSAALSVCILLGCESSDDEPAPELGSVKVQTRGLEGDMELSLNDEESLYASDRQHRNSSYDFQTFVFDQLVETGETIDIQIISQSNNSFCEIGADEDMVFDANENSYFYFNCLPFSQSLVTITSFDTSDTHTCAITDGSVRCFSDNSDHRRIPSVLDKPQLVRTGHDFSCAVDESEVICWGDDDQEVLAVSPPDIVGELEELELGFNSGCLIDSEGLKCWGDESSTIVNQYPENLNAPSNLSINWGDACVVESGRPHCWGSSLIERADIPQELTHVTDMDLGSGYACGVTESNVYCWGYSDAPIEVPEDLGAARRVYAGFTTACAMTDNGLRCWGSEFSQLALTDRLVVFEEDIVLASGHGCVNRSGSLICFGINDRGQRSLR